MGRKRNQGKARKAAKAKAREEAKESNTQVTDGRQRQQSLAAHWQQLESVAALTSSNTTKCRHGFEMFDSVCLDFTREFRTFYQFASYRGEGIMRCLLAAEHATKIQFAGVWNNSTKMETAMSCLFSIGTSAILEGSNDVASDCASIARYLEEYIAVVLKQTQALFYSPKIREAQNPSDVHTLVKFFRKRIPCCCLDEKYEEVKYTAKTGLCFNLQCHKPCVKRSKTMYCSRCRCVTYCSPECQKADWKIHKEDCLGYLKEKANFEMKQKA
mmetsp:Transcript_22227/g.33477  ORF Transcript_22227/g.33477 Transcript_22227/m.33477 type:complete len:271 (-) Transcript_22227:121-933(-)